MAPAVGPILQVAHNQEAYSTRQGMAVAFQNPVTAGSALVAIVIGKRNPAPYTPGATSDPYAKDLDDNGPANPVITNAAGSATGWTFTSGAKLQDIDALEAAQSYSAGANFDAESKPNYDGAYDSIFIGEKTVGVGTGETVKIMNAYIGAQSTTVQDLNGAAGVSIFNEGVNAVVLEIAAVGSVVSAEGRTTTANPARSSGSNIGGLGDMLIAVGLCKNGNVFSASSGWTVAYADKCVTNQEHFVVAYKLLSTADRASFDNPLGMEMAVLTLCLAP